MALNPAIFVRGDERYQADACEPLVAAARAGQIQFAAAVHGHYPGVKLRAGELPELCSAGGWNAPHDQAWGLDWHRNEGIEFTYLFSGQLDFAVDGTSHRLRPGHLTITRPWQRHRVGQPNIEASHLGWLILDVGVRRPNQAWRWPDWLILTREEREHLTTLLRHNEQSVWKIDPGLGRHFQKLEELAATAGLRGRHFDRTRMALSVNELLLGVHDMLVGRDIPLDDTLTSSQRCVEMFLAGLPGLVGEPWSVDTMAEHCGLKRSRFTLFCRQLTNRTPAQHLAYCRVKEAARLLRERPEVSIAEIAHACGFASSQHFATTFHALKRVTPSQWRQGCRISGSPRRLS